MKIPARVYNSMVVLNTLAIFLIVLAGVAVGVVKRDDIGEKLTSFVDREAAGSKFLAATGLQGGDVEPSEYPVYDLKIKPTHLRQIEEQVQQLVQARVLSDEMKTWFPARFYHGKQEYKVKIRLKGDAPDHWAGKRKSWRVKFDKENLFEGRRYLDLVLPSDKAYEVEPVSYEVARDLGLLVPDAGFCRVRLNGVDFGMYLWMEKYGKEMLEKQGYPAAELFRQRNVWYRDYWTGMGIYPTYYTSTYQNSLREDDTVGYYAQRWDRLVRLMREGDDEAFERELPHLVDMEKYLAWNAVTWLFGSTHAHWGDNLRWYYDDTSGLFEPILYDINRYSMVLPKSPSGAWRWRFDEGTVDRLARRVLKIPQYCQERNEILWRLIHDERFDVARRCDDYYQPLRQALLTGVDAPDSRLLDERHAKTIQILRDNREQLGELLSFASVFVTPVLSFDGEIPVVNLRLLPDSRSPIMLEQVELVCAEGVAEALADGIARTVLIGPEGGRQELDDVTVSVRDSKTITLQFDDLAIWTPMRDDLSRYPGEWTLRVEFPEIDAGDWRRPGFVTAIHTSCRNSASREPVPEHELMSYALVYDFDADGPSPLTWPIEEFVAYSELPFVREGQVLKLPQGDYVIRRNLTVPDGYALRIEAGTVLKMSPGVSFVCHGDLQAEGSMANPIRIIPEQPDVPWGSFAVVRAGQPSRMQHVIISGGSEARIDGLYLSGQICFYHADVNIEHCTFSNAVADDGLNIKRAAFTITDCLFRDNSADAFDGDWVSGTVAATTFVDNGGDGVDFSGSRVVIRDCLLTHMGDKAVSAGEKSEILAFNNVFENSIIGVASKDLSNVGMYACVFRKNKTAIALYRKKQIFGGATGQVVGSLFWDNHETVQADEESSLEAISVGADRWQASEHVVVKNLLRGDPERFYRRDHAGNIRHTAVDVAVSPFRISENTDQPLFGDLEVPDLNGSPAGLWRPLALGERALAK